MELVNVSNGAVLAHQVEQAHTFGRRLKGLMFRNHLPETHAMHIQPCRSIHTFFMRFPIDVLYLDEALKVVHIAEHLRTGKVTQPVLKARSVVELVAGTIQTSGTKVGDHILMQQNS